MRLVSISLDSVDFDNLEGVKTAFPLPMPVYVKRRDEQCLLYPVVNKLQWANTASLNQEVSVDLKAIVPIPLAGDDFQKHFMPLGGQFDGSGVYGKIPKPVRTLRVDIPCSYSNSGQKKTVPAGSVVVRTDTGLFRHFDQAAFERMFVSDVSKLMDMQIRVKLPKPAREIDLSSDYNL